MDFLHRGGTNQPQARSTASHHVQPTATAATHTDGMKKLISQEPRWLRVAFVVLLFSLTVLAIALASLFYFGKEREAHYVNAQAEQAVFLTNGQVYFGKIVAINKGYLDLQDIYYLNSQQQPESQNNQNNAQQTNFSLVKLGCELHGPVDQMVINRDQVSFWENLKSTGKVAQAIKQWRTQNPNGQTCSNTSTNTQPSSGSTNNTQQSR